MRRLVSFFAFLSIALTAACGRELNETFACPDAPPADLCLGACGSNPQPVCSSAGVWTCQTSGGGACPRQEDAGEDAGGCTGAPPQLYCGLGCGYGWETARCVGSTWQCPQSDLPLCFEGEDAGPPPDANPPSFSCGDLACDPATTYCQIDTGGALQPDGGVSSSYACVPLLAGCVGQASCGCTQTSSACGCLAENGEVIVTCAVP